MICAAFLLAGCSGFLNVNPKGEVFDADMFNSAEGYEDALYGVYSELATGDHLYAGNFFWVPEVLSQNVSSSDYKLGYMGRGDWYTTGPKGIREGMWTDAYKAVNHLNNIVAHAEKDGRDRFAHSGLYYGEAVALRALVHFELLRLFGPPVWASASEKSTVIPYVSRYSFALTPFGSLDEVFDAILSDLKLAESLLGEDETLVTAQRSNLASGFTAARITHLNLYAVQALLARVYWYRGDLPHAAEYARKVIDSGKFSFRNRSAFVQPDNGTLDMNETLFGFYSLKFNESNARQYGLSGTSSATFELADDWNALYDDGSSVSRADYRINAWFDAGSSRLTKLANGIYYAGGTASYDGSAILGANVLRLPEMYYILAEAHLADHPAAARDAYNAVIVTRGLDALPEDTPLTAAMLFRERRKEFYGEGLTWLQMKRDAMDITTPEHSILPGSQVSTYTLPVPDAESEARKNLN